MVTQMSASSMFAFCFYSLTAALAQELRQLPLEEALRRPGSKEAIRSVSKHAGGVGL
jgi:hypothetical protein